MKLGRKYKIGIAGRETIIGYYSGTFHDNEEGDIENVTFERLFYCKPGPYYYTVPVKAIESIEEITDTKSAALYEIAYRRICETGQCSYKTDPLFKSIPIFIYSIQDRIKHKL